MKKLLTSLCVGAGILAMASLVSAETFNVRIYGASAQKKFWTNAAPSYLSNVLGCTGTVEYDGEDPAILSNDDYGGTRGTGCNVDGAATGGNFNDDTVNFHYASKASYDGVMAVQNQWYDDGGSEPCSGDHSQREFGTNGCFPGDAGTCELACADVTIGASDVSGEAFTQSSLGSDVTDWTAANSPVYGSYLNRSFAGLDTSLADAKNPIVVPFAFFANKSVTVSRCEAPTVTADSTYPQWGNPCTPDASNYSADCIGYTSCVSNSCVGGANAGGDCTNNGVYDCPDAILSETSCVAKPISEISRLQAVLIFSGQVSNWNFFGKGYPSDLPIVRCMRHAGSGTHATFDIQVFKGTSKSPANRTFPALRNYLHTSSSDLAKCINYNDGAIGYMDADKNIKSTKNDTVLLKYQGYLPTRENIKKGNYNFWAAQYSYYRLAELQENSTDYPTGTEDLVIGTDAAKLGLLNWAGLAANVTEANFGPRALYWATQAEMDVEKATSDRNFPSVAP